VRQIGLLAALGSRDRGQLLFAYLHEGLIERVNSSSVRGYFFGSGIAVIPWLTEGVELKLPVSALPVRSAIMITDRPEQAFYLGAISGEWANLEGYVTALYAILIAGPGDLAHTEIFDHIRDVRTKRHIISAVAKGVVKNRAYRAKKKRTALAVRQRGKSTEQVHALPLVSLCSVAEKAHLGAAHDANLDERSRVNRRQSA
jgi:hypothetical protein